MAFKWLLDEDGEGGKIRCFGGDSRPYFPDTASLINPIAPAPVDQYGALGYDLGGQNPNPIAGVTPPWFTCPFIDWSDGPENELVPQQPIYLERWQLFFNLGNGLVSYRRSGTPFVAAPAALFPAPLIPTNRFTDFTLSFDGDASPVFAYADLVAGTVELRRFVVGVPTLDSFVGSSPKLFYDGQVQRDTALRDVVLYYIRAGNIFARFQRDNFAVEYFMTDFSAAFGAATRLTKVDRNLPAGAPLPAGNPIFHYLFALGTPATVEVMLQAGPYPPFPLELVEPATFDMSTPAAGAYLTGIVFGGNFDDAGSFAMPAAPSGVYFLAIVNMAPQSDAGTFAMAQAPAGSYDTVIVVAATQNDDGTFTMATAPAGAYTLVVVDGGSYTDDGSFNMASAPSGVYAP